MPKTARPALGLAVFFLIAFGVPWAGWVWLRRTVGLDHMFDSFALYWFTAAPSFAGFAAATAEGGFAGLARFARRVCNLRFTLWLWPLVLILPLVAALLTFTDHSVDLRAGGPPHWSKLAGLASLLNFFTGPLAEEFGWHGYLLGRLCRRVHPALAGAIIGPIWAAWHIPLFYDSVFATLSSALFYLAWITAWSVVLSLAVAQARGSVLPAVFGHWAVNIAPLVFFILLPALPGEKQPGSTAFAVTSVIVAIVLTWLWRHVRWQPDEPGVPVPA